MVTDRPKYFSPLNTEEPKRMLPFLSNNLDLADQFEKSVLLLEKKAIFNRKSSFFLSIPQFFNHSHDFQQWLDACAHFADAMLFTEETMKMLHQLKSYRIGTTMRYPMETIVLGKEKQSMGKNSWILPTKNFPYFRF